MVRQTEKRQKISLLIAMAVLFILVSMAGFGSAVVYSISRLQSNTEEAYIRPFAVSNAGLKAHVTLSRLHNDMIKIILANDPAIVKRLDSEMRGLDESLHKDLLIVRAELPGDTEKTVEIEALLNKWENTRAQLIGILRQGHTAEALKLAMGVGTKIYGQLEAKMSDIVFSAQHHAEIVVIDAKIRAAKIIRTVWWLLGGLVGSGVLFGAAVIGRVGAILEHEKHIVRKLHESEERMKLALSGANEGTWDLDVVTGRLSFDSQWGVILEFAAEKDRPRYFEDWSMLIHAEDRARVLQTMRDHVDGSIFQFRNESERRVLSLSKLTLFGFGLTHRCFFALPLLTSFLRPVFSSSLRCL